MCLLPRFNFQSWQSFSRDFSLPDHTLPTRPEPAWQKMAQSPLNGTTKPVDIEQEAWSTTMDRWWLKEIYLLENSDDQGKAGLHRFSLSCLCTRAMLELFGLVWLSPLIRTVIPSVILVPPGCICPRIVVSLYFECQQVYMTADHYWQVYSELSARLLFAQVSMMRSRPLIQHSRYKTFIFVWSRVFIGLKR